jgi:TonB family protein
MMRLKRTAILMQSCALTILCACNIASAAQTGDPNARLQKVEGLYSLDTVYEKPWHLKMNITVLSDQGQNPQQGTVEVWNTGRNRRVTFDFGTAKLTRLTTDGDSYRSTTDNEVPYRAMELLERELSMGPSSADLQHDFAGLQMHKFGKLKLECIMLTPTAQMKDVPLGLFPTYCLQPGSDRLVVSYDVGDEVTMIQREGTFLGRAVPTMLQIAENKVLVATAEVTLLTTYEPQPDDFVPAADMKKGSDIARLSGSVIAGSRLTFVQPIYPESAKINHLSGTVTLHALIDRGGHIRSLRPVNTSDPDFITAAIAAVRQWTYRPYLLNGEPTEVDTTITVNFAINGRLN